MGYRVARPSHSCHNTETDPKGDGSKNVETIRDGVKPVAGSSDPLTQYESFDNTTGSAEEFCGYTFTSAKVFSSAVFQEGMHFNDGGWFSGGTLKVQVRRNGAWAPVDATASPAYPTADAPASFGQSFQTFTFRPGNVEGDGIRIAGTSGGSAHFVSIGELEVWGTDKSVTGAANQCSRAPAARVPARTEWHSIDGRCFSADSASQRAVGVRMTAGASGVARSSGVLLGPLEGLHRTPGQNGRGEP